MSAKPPPTLPPGSRVLLSLLLPFVGAILVSGLVSGSFQLSGGDQGLASLRLAGAGLVSWFIGLRWYGIDGLGLRGRRPLYASIGFAVLGWLAFILARLLLASREDQVGATNAGQTFVYLLLFEAFCIQLWAFGTFFRSAADWRGPLTAAVTSGVLFGALGFIYFQESYLVTAAGLLFFIIWGVLYGIIRLRTGSLIGTVIIQAIQSWTAWQILFPVEQPDVSQLRIMYLVASLLFALIIWRLWPRREDDYRV